MKKKSIRKYPPGRDISKLLLKMKLLTAFLFIVGFTASASSYSQQTKFNLALQDVTVRDVFAEIEKKSDFIIIYNEKSIDLNRKVDIRVKDQTVETILEALFMETINTWRIYDRQIVIFPYIKPLPVEVKTKAESIPQPRRKELSGTVTDSQGVPLPGVNVIVKGTTQGAITDLSGKFSLSAPIESEFLVFSFIGMETVEQFIGERTSFSIILVETAMGIDEVVVVGYGQQKKITVTGAVSSVTNEELVQTPVANISNALAGRATGILAMQRSGEPGEDASQIRIRGIGTFSGSQAPLILVDGIESESYNNIDAHEIESITILKDASSTAVYGVRGANGVIIITTRRGQTGKPTVSLSSNLAATSFIAYPERLRSYEWASSYNEAQRYDSYVSGVYAPFWSEGELQTIKDQSDPVFLPDSDWPDYMFKDFSLQHQHNLNMRGGTEKVKYFASIGHLDQRGHFNNTNLIDDFFDQQIKFKRYNFRTNFDFAVTDRFSIALNLSSQIENKSSFAGTANSFVRSIAITNPLQSPALVDGKFVSVPSSRVGSGNVLAGLYGTHIKNYNNYLDGSVRLNYDLDFLTKGLRTHAMISYQNYNRHNMTFNKPVESFNAFKDENGETVFISNQADGVYSSNQSYGKNRQSYFEVGLNYARSFGDHNLGALLLYNQTKKFDPGLAFLIPSGYQGLVGRLTYDYKNRYLIEYNAGYNGTENFAPGKRFGFFPAYSLGWVASEESFFPENNIVTFLKFRGSYGEVGNDKIGGSRFLYLPSAYTLLNRRYHFGTVGSNVTEWEGAYEGKIGNSNLIWERARKTNFGFELTLFKDKLRITADRFIENRDNILTTPQTTPILSGMGDNIPAVNLGKVENSGYDGDITFRSRKGQFNYWIKANYTFARNTLVYRDEIPNPYPYLMRTGQTIGQQFGLVSDGLYNSWEDVGDAYRPLSSYNTNYLQPGDINWKDINGDGTIDQFDQAPIGYSQFPEKTFGFSFGGDFKGFDFSMLLQGASNVTYRGSLNIIYLHYNNYAAPKYIYDYAWTQERYEQGGDIRHPRIYVGGGPGGGNNSAVGNYNFVDASYIRLRNAEIGYRITKEALNRIGINSLRLYINGSNLFTWAPMWKKFPGVDPEDYSIQGSELEANTEPYPRIRVFNFGINANF